MCWERKGPGYRFACTALFYRILAECCVQSAAEKLPDPRIRDAVDYLRNHYTKSDLTVGEAATKSFISEVYFRKLFRSAFGVSPQACVIRLTGDYPLKEVALLCGYRDYKHFSAEFRRATGRSPSEYAGRRR